ncbi:MAG: DUF6249 domain-containing protein [Nitrosomonas sp.]|nr:DUF6249 domain-containing protein [Nitrosomonas sp.]
MGDLIPIVFFIVIAACIITPVYLSHRTRVKELETLTKLADCNEEIRNELLKFMRRNTDPRSDLRKGVVLIALALPIIVAFIVDGSGINSIIFGGIPLLVGLAFIYMAKSAKTTTRDLTN